MFDKLWCISKSKVSNARSRFIYRSKDTAGVSYGDSAEKAFRDIGDDDANEKDDGVQPVVTKHH